MRRFLPLVALAFALPAASACAHNELPHPEWCASGRIVVVAGFNLTPELLREVRDRCRPDPDQGGAPPRHCDQFDDDYDVGRRTALSMCTVHQADPLGPGDIGSVIHLVEHPPTYNDDAHHQLYRVEQGLSGLCLRCEAAPRPFPPDRSQ
ncbi:MAG: hypothetical protein KF823_06400 [Xanthomonadales bacterium]|nr:hypothetical protein [Xanthomonadales bacterium]